jgi:hypothetical protein
MLPFVSQNVYRKAPGPALLPSGDESLSTKKEEEEKEKNNTL